MQQNLLALSLRCHSASTAAHIALLNDGGRISGVVAVASTGMITLFRLNAVTNVEYAGPWRRRNTWINITSGIESSLLIAVFWQLIAESRIAKS